MVRKKRKLTDTGVLYVRIPASLEKSVKARAKLEGRTVKSVVIRALRYELAQPALVPGTKPAG